MKILKLLNKKNLSIFIIYILVSSSNIKAEEEVFDIWDLEKNSQENSSILNSENYESDEMTIEIKKKNLKKISDIIDSDLLEENNIKIAGLYDPEDNELNIDMWSNSNGNEIKLILNKINKMNLSKDSKEILDIALLTNSYFPRENITEEEFIDFKLNYLINNNNELIKLYLLKNEGTIYNSKLIKFYINSYLESADLENACEIFNEIKYFNDDYINKFIIWLIRKTLISNNV